MMSETATTAGRIAESLGERIISGALQPDAPLRQDHIAREFNSSHVPVREAFRRLEAQHLVVAVPRRGVRVAPLDANSVKEIAEMRAALEGDNAETIQDFEAANRAFHHALVAPCAMPRLLASLDGLQLANSRLVFATAHSAGWQPRSNQDH